MVLKRRSAKAGFAVLAVSALVLAGCSNGDSNGGGNGNSGGGDVPAGSEGGDVVFAIDSPWLSMDPNQSPAAQDARVLRQVFDGLTAVSDTGAVVPWLATDWEISEDGLDYTFTVRDDVTFHDGTAFDAEAVCFNLDRIKDPNTASRYAISLIGPYASCEAPDATTAVVTFDTPYAAFLRVLSSPFLGMVSPTAASAVEPAEFQMASVGSGPFKLDLYVPDDRVELSVNEDYNWAPETAGHQGRAYLDTLTYRLVPDATVRLGSVRSGEFEAIGNVPEVDAQGVQNDASLEFYAVSQSGAPYNLYFNTDHAPFDDQDVREAIRMAIDIESMVQALYLGVYERAWGPLSPTTAMYDSSIEGAFDFDPEAAAEMLDDAGWTVGSDGIRAKDGQKLTIRYVENAVNREKRQDIAEFVRANLSDIGVEVNIQLAQTAAATEINQAGEYEIYGLSLVNVEPNVVYSIFAPQFIPEPGKSGFNFARVDDNEELYQLAIDGQQITDETERAEIYAEIQAHVIEKAYTIPIYVPTYTMATNGIQGMRFDAEGYPIWYDVSLGG